MLQNCGVKLTKIVQKIFIVISDQELIVLISERTDCILFSGALHRAHFSFKSPTIMQVSESLALLYGSCSFKTHLFKKANA